MTSQTPTWSTTPGGRAAPGTIIGERYALRAGIGTGGMGTVWRATDMLLGREVAVKEVVYPPGLAPSDREAMYERTLREARAAAQLSHPSIVQVYDVVIEDDRPWIVMELLDARSLADIVIEDGPLAPRAVAKIGIALLGALEVAHAAGVLHRDVKPANVLICSDGRCVLTDFGVARMPTDVQLTTPGMVLGSPHFISPERAMGRPFGPPSDLFSLGVSLYTAVEGRPPFDRGDPIETMHAVVEDPPAPSVRAGPLATVLFGLLEKEPARRWDVPTARSVLRDLLAGPLATKAADQATDPYAVVTAAVPTLPAAPARATRPAPAILHNGASKRGTVGGRAMLAADESLHEAIACRQARTGMASPSDRPGLVALARARDWPIGLRLAVIGGLAAVLLTSVALVVTELLSGSPAANTAPANPTPASASPSAGPLIEVQQYIQGPITVNIPAGWKRQPPKNGTYMDFVDPADPGRWVRINIEKASVSSGRAVLESADRRFTNPRNGCPGYEKLGLTDVTLAGRQAAQLEYRCSPPNAPMRHGLWQAVVLNGKTYAITLSVPEARFEESRIIMTEMARSFTLTG